MKKPITVPERLELLSRIFKARDAVYGKNYIDIGFVLAGFFANGITLKTPKDFARFASFVAIAVKAGRYAACFTTGGHNDSLDDLSVTAQLLRDLDEVKWMEEAPDDDDATN